MLQIKDSQRLVYGYVNELVKSKGIKLSQFWYSERLVEPLQTFLDMLALIGLDLKNEEIQKLEDDGVEFLSLDALLEGVEEWKKAEGSISNFLSNKNKVVQEKKNEHKYQPAYSVTSSSNSMKQSTNKFLAQHAKKQIQEEVKLRDTLRTAKNQSDYQISIKVGQANDICGKLNNGVQYLVSIGNDGNLQIFKQSKNEGKLMIQTKKFEKEFESLRLSFMNEPEEYEGNLQNDLKQVLVQVMCLSDDIKKQIKLIERKGVSH